ncbi:hypothetical protein SteCoe_10422 [Stentor coeruleus]|uniref:Dickkopf N-terminal cysteine-rich domain-containing protein n=1 Tax=Stentor coeruleus TaxID=5963 RepID=A0A1R2CFR4_9CILI|nr:hypothetical protein SteCoe_10422 [Stentor coeruleus]
MLGVKILFIALACRTVFALCPTYQCETKGFPNQSTCLYLDNSTSINYVRPCEGDYACVSISSTLSECQYKSSYIPHTQVAGASCLYNQDCVNSNTCINDICRGYSKYSNCTSHLDCDIGLYCYPGNKTCIPQLKKGQTGCTEDAHCVNETCIPQLKKGQTGCTEDAHCVNDAGCQILSTLNPQSNVCTEYFSLTDYTVLIGCSQSGDINYLCKSGFCANVGTATSVCYPAPQSAKTPPVLCLKDSYCLSKPAGTSKVVFNTTCNCGLNDISNMFCSLFPGDSVYNEYDSMVRDWIESDDILKCNTYGRFGAGCMKTHWSTSKFKEFTRKMYKAYNYSQIITTDDCMIEISFSEYYKALEYSSGAGYIFAGLLGLSLA